jgi:hypothetical protein
VAKTFKTTAIAIGYSPIVIAVVLLKIWTILP